MAHASVARTASVDRLAADLIALAHEIAEDEGLGMQTAAVLAVLYRDGLTDYGRAWDASADVQRQTVRPCCPACGVELVSIDCYVGGRGYIAFTVCPDDGSHYSRRA